MSTNLTGPAQPQSLTAVVGVDGIWRQSIPELPESFNPWQIASSISSGRTIILRDLLIGKTFLCSGLFLNCFDIVAG